MKKIAVILVSLMTALTSFVPAQAMPVPTVTSAAGTTEVQQVQYREHRRIIRRNGHRYDRRDRYTNHRRWDYRNRHSDRDYYGRRHNNNGAAIIGGLAAGAIIGGAIASQNRNSGSKSCAARYRSYRASDNTYQPNYGPRRVCR
ncbi:hypothetical protein ASG25_01915 [Rhizobium sp. Leaf384]|uniref:BA14K family protein n=1 Tax=unclassified Rhizobium TaxID=2613769 RepID=UPI0007137A35|nr:MULTISPECIES: BA14K family protein [unclassified Rhizobium]KQS74195.1 hypothetical protein ASG58_16980 [Rhizobium sp. Leaf383]KQS80390.1 hypothetical protein ASG25_01915 [Rhizobium sp. Leaf384]